jgi:hypothetical protein
MTPALFSHIPFPLPMPTTLTAADVNDDLAFYIENKAQALSHHDTFAINNYIDQEAFNPDVKAYLNSPQAASVLGDAPSEAQEPAAAMALSLNMHQEMRFFSIHFPEWLRFRFLKFKGIVKDAFCGVVTTIGDADLKTIIQAVLTALIPAFGAGGLPGIVSGIVIGFVALLLKGGIQAACPV